MEKLGKPRPALFRALGKIDPPLIVEVDGVTYQRIEIFKHDSWAATALYEGGGQKIVCKFNRKQSILGFPMRWLGRLLARREAYHFQRLADIPLVPRLFGTVYADGVALPNTVAHAFVAGHPLRADEKVDADFCDALIALFDEVHRRGMAYVDLHKRENVLVGDDGKPYLIDFQVSWTGNAEPNRRGWISGWILRQMQAADRYHLQKHLSHLEPARFGTSEATHSARPWWIRIHRVFAQPLRGLRRRFLVLLGVRRGKGRAETEHFAEDAVRQEQDHAKAA